MARAQARGLIGRDQFGRVSMHPAAVSYVFARNKRAIAGDPGFFGDIFHGITGAIGGLLSGNPLNAITGGIKGFMGGGKAQGTTAAISGASQGMALTGPLGTNAQGFNLPSGAGGVGVGPGGGGGFNIGGPYGITLGGGVGGAGGGGGLLAPGLTAPAAGGAVMSGYHLNKHGYYTKGGHYVAPRSKQVKNRRRNPLNPRALHRSLARLHSAKHAIKALHLIPPRRQVAARPFQRKARR
jgi:hypothetical protein